MLEADQRAVFFRSSHGVGSGGLIVVIRAAAGGGTGVAVMPLCNIKAARGAIILIVPATSCAGRLVSAEPVWISLIE